MDRVEIKRHLNTIVGNIASIRSLTGQANFDDFRKNDGLRENVYEYLQEIGEAAYALRKAKLDPTMSVDALEDFRNARYNDEAEIQHQNVWNLVELDLPVIRREIQHSDVFSRVPVETKDEEGDGESP